MKEQEMCFENLEDRILMTASPIENDIAIIADANTESNISVADRVTP